MSEEISYPIASNSKRLTAFMIDDIAISMLFFIVFYNQFSELFSSITVLDEATLLTINMFISQNIVIVFLMKLLYHTIFVWQNGMTLGKYMMKIKVIDLQTGDTPNFQKALLRGLVRLISEVLFYFGFIMAFFMPMNQTLHDKLSTCIVVDA